MKVLVTMIATAVGFGVGVFAGNWMQRTRPVPPPPMGLMGEIRDVPFSGNGTASSPHRRSRPELEAELEKMKPEIEAFRKKVDPIKSEFKQSLEALLNPEQKERLKVLNERWATPPPNPNATAEPSGEPHAGRPTRPRDGLESLFPIVLVANTLERLTDELKLDETQQAEVRTLLQQRRAKFLDLVDHSPPPSLRLGRLAPPMLEGQQK